MAVTLDLFTGFEQATVTDPWPGVSHTLGATANKIVVLVSYENASALPSNAVSIGSAEFHAEAISETSTTRVASFYLDSIDSGWPSPGTISVVVDPTVTTAGYIGIWSLIGAASGAFARSDPQVVTAATSVSTTFAAGIAGSAVLSGCNVNQAVANSLTGGTQRFADKDASGGQAGTFGDSFPTTTAAITHSWSSGLSTRRAGLLVEILEAAAAGPTPAGNLNQDLTLTAGTTYLIRARVENSGDAGGTGFKWQYNRLSAGWTDLTTTSTHVRAVAAATFANNDDTSQVLGGSGTYLTNNDAASEDGTVTLPSSFPASGAVELVLSFQLIAAALANGNTIDFRIVRSDGTPLDTYTQVFTATVAGAGPVTVTATLSLAAVARRQNILASATLAAAARHMAITTSASLSAGGRSTKVAGVSFNATSRKEITAFALVAAAASISRSAGGSVDARAALVRTITAALAAVARKQLAASASLLAAGGPSQTTRTTTLAAVTRALRTLQADLAAAASVRRQLTGTLNATTRKQIAQTLTLQALGRATLTLAAALDGRAQIPGSRSASLNAVTRKSIVGTALLGVAARGTLSLPVSLQAFGQLPTALLLSSTLEALGRHRVVLAATLTTAGQTARSRTATIAAVSQLRRSHDAMLQALSRVTRSQTAGFDAVTRKSLTLAASLDVTTEAFHTLTAVMGARARATLSTAASLNAMGQPAGTLAVQSGLEAAAQVARTRVTTMAAAAQVARLQSATFDAAARLRAGPIMASLDGTAERMFLRSTSLSAVGGALPSIGASFDANAVLSGFVAAAFDGVSKRQRMAGASLDAISGAVIPVIKGPLQALGAGERFRAIGAGGVLQARRK